MDGTPIRAILDAVPAQRSDVNVRTIPSEGFFRTLLGRVLALRAIMMLWQGKFQRAFAYARESLELLSDDDATWRGTSLICVGLGELLSGEMNSAQNRVIEARALCGVAQNIHGVLAALVLSADAYVWQGDFEQATALYHQVLTDAVGDEAMLDVAFNGIGKKKQEDPNAIQVKLGGSGKVYVPRDSIVTVYAGRDASVENLRGCVAVSAGRNV